MTVEELMNKCARHENLQDEVRIEVPQLEGGFRARSIVSADNDPRSGMFLIEVDKGQES